MHETDSTNHITGDRLNDCAAYYTQACETATRDLVDTYGFWEVLNVLISIAVERRDLYKQDHAQTVQGWAHAYRMFVRKFYPQSEG